MASRRVSRMIQEAAELLLQGSSGAEVRARINARYSTLASQKTAISNVRKRVMEIYEPDITPMRAYEEEEGVGDFLHAPLSERVAIQRRHTYEPEWSVEAEECLQRLVLLPPSMKDFGLSHAEVIRFKKDSAEALRRRNENVMVIQEPGALLEMALAMLETCNTSSTLGAIVLPLLLVSGRRSSEILNGKSVFEPAPHPFYCYFTGQLKTRGKGERYMIPLLCPFATFCIGLNALRQKEGDVSHLTEKQLNSRYQVRLKQQINGGALPYLPSGNVTPHTLRSFYAAFVFHCYNVPDTFNRMCMKICGHADLTESLCYNAVRIVGGQMLAGKFGPLYV